MAGYTPYFRKKKTFVKGTEVPASSLGLALYMVGTSFKRGDYFQTPTGAFYKYNGLDFEPHDSLEVL